MATAAATKSPAVTSDSFFRALEVTVVNRFSFVSIRPHVKPITILALLCLSYNHSI